MSFWGTITILASLFSAFISTIFDFGKIGFPNTSHQIPFKHFKFQHMLRLFLLANHNLCLKLRKYFQMIKKIFIELYSTHFPRSCTSAGAYSYHISINLIWRMSRPAPTFTLLSQNWERSSKLWHLSTYNTTIIE